MTKIYNKPIYDLNQENISEQNLSGVIGVYVLFNAFGNPKFVGQTENLGNRLKSYSLSSPNYEFFSYWKCNNISEADNLTYQILDDFDLEHYNDIRKNFETALIINEGWGKNNDSTQNRQLGKLSVADLI